MSLIYRAVMAIPESVVAAVVKDVSKRMKEPSYAQVAIGSFAENQPDIARYIGARAKELGGSEGVVQVAFHGEVMIECFRKHAKKEPRRITFRDLDACARFPVVSELTKRQPALADYVASNVDGAEIQKALALVGLALDKVAGG